MSDDQPLRQDQPNNPLHGVKLEDMVTRLLDRYGWTSAALDRGAAFDHRPGARRVLRGLSGAAAALGQEIGRVTAQITRRNVNLQPTLEIRPGYLFNIEVTADIVLPGPYQPAPTLP